MELLERFALGEIDAFETVFRQFQRDIYGWIVRVVRNPATAEDLTIETFWRIYRSRSHFDPKREFGAWAHRIATHVAFSHLKGARREISLAYVPPGACTAPGAADREIHAAIRLTVADLPPKLRDVAVAVLIEEQPYSEVARALGISVAAVKSREFRAVRLLRKKLERMGVTP